MRLKAKRTLSLALALAMCLSCLCVTSFAAVTYPSQEVIDAILAVNDYSKEVPDKTPQARMDRTATPQPVNVTLEASATFTTDPMTAETAKDITEPQLFFGKWEAEFLISVNKDVDADVLKAWGYYEMYGDWVGVPMGACTANQPIRVIRDGLPTEFKDLFAPMFGKVERDADEETGTAAQHDLYGIPYAAVAYAVQEFKCGIDVEKFNKVDPDTVATLEMRLYAPRPLKGEEVDAIKEKNIDLVWDEAVGLYYIPYGAEVFPIGPAASITRGETTEYYLTLAEAVAAATSGDTIKLLKDYDMEANEPGYGYTTSFLVQGETTARNNMLEFSANNITFDLGGHTLSNLFNNTFSVTGSNVTIKNGEMRVGELYYSSLDGTKVYTSDNDKTCSYIVYVTGAQNFVVNNLTTYGGINVIGAGTTGSATATINNLHFSGTKFYAVCSQEGASVTLNGGTYDKSMAGSGKNLFYVGSDDPNMGDSYLYITGGYYEQGEQAGFSVIGNDPHIVISGGTFDKQPAQNYLATGYTTEQISGGTYDKWYTVVADSDAFTEVTKTSNDTSSSSTTAIDVTKETIVDNTTTTQTFAFATTDATSDDASYAIKVETQVTVNEVAGVSTTTYQPVQTAVTNAGEVSGTLTVNTADESLNGVAGATIDAAKVETEAAVTKESSTTITAKKDNSNISILGTQAAGNAFAKAAAQDGVNNERIKKAEVEMRSTLKAYTLKDKGEGVTATSVTVNIDPYAILKDANGNQLGDAVKLEDSDLTAEGIVITFKQAVPFEPGTLVNVKHDKDGNGVFDLAAGDELLENLVVDASREITITTSYGTSPFTIERISETTVDSGSLSTVNYVDSYSLTLTDMIGVNFFLHLTGTVKDDLASYSLKFTFPGKYESGKTVSLSSGELQTDGTYMFTYSVAPAEADKGITLSLCKGETIIPLYSKAGEVSDNGTYTRTLNAVTRVAVTNGSVKLKPLASKLLAYCEYTKQYFDGATVAVETDVDLGDKVAATTALSAYAKTVGSTESGVKYNGTSLLLGTETTIKMFFLASGEHTFVCKVQGGSSVNDIIVEQSGGEYIVKIPHLTAPELDTKYEIYVDGEDTPYVTYNALSWAYNVIQKTDSYKYNLGNAMYWYNKEANVYFEN